MNAATGELRSLSASTRPLENHGWYRQESSRLGASCQVSSLTPIEWSIQRQSPTPLPAASRGEKTKPNKANGLKARKMREMYEKFRKQSQAIQTTCYQRLAAKNRLFFAKNEWNGWRNQGIRKTNPNEAIVVKPFRMSEMHEKFRKRSQCVQAACYQRLGANNGPFFAKNEWTAGQPRIRENEPKRSHCS
jgi:hypothetical protein